MILLTILIGLILGSFTSALSWRVARGEGWVKGRSRCPQCGANLTARDLIPIFSWLFLRGRCRHCRARIGIRYPLIELGILAGCLAVYVAWGFTTPGLLGMLALPFLVTLLLVDVDQMILPDSMNLILAAGGLLFSAILHVLPMHALAALIYGGIIWLAGWIVGRVLKKDALGLGDVKFMAVAGLWLGLAWLPYFLLIAGAAGVIFGVLWRYLRGQATFPFGPALIAAFFACFLLYGFGIHPLIP